MVLHNVPKLHGLIGLSIVTAAVAGPVSCSNDDFSGCEASRTCAPGKGGSGTDSGGEAGEGATTGGRSGSGPGRGGSSGSAGTDGGGRAGDGGTSAGGTSGEGGEPGNGGEGGSAEPPDTTPPTVVSVSPANGATGVRGNTNLVVTFSEPMDRVTTQAAYQSADIPGSAATFSWNRDSTVLTVNPNEDLRYADGDDVDVVAQQFAAAITDTAADRSGNSLATDFDWSFRTLRRITQTFTEGSILRVTSEGQVPSYACPAIAYGNVGDYPTNAGRFFLVTRDISALPTGIVEWEAVSLSGEQVGASHEGVFDALGPLLTYHVSVSPPEAASWTTPPLRTLGAFSTDVTPGTRSVDVQVALVDDYEHRAERNQMSQYRIGFAQITNGDGVGDAVYLSCIPTFALTSRYLVP